MVDVEKFRILLQAERDRKASLLPSLRDDISSANAARQNSNVEARLEARPWTPYCIGHASGKTGHSA